MGSALGRGCRGAGAEVTLVYGQVQTALPDGMAHSIEAISAEAMYRAVHQHIANQDVFISVAAVADYKVKNSSEQKIKKQIGVAPVIELTENPDILASVSMLDNPPFCVGFAAESHDLLNHARAKRIRKNVPLLVANLVGEAMGKATNGKATKLLIPLLTGTMRELNLQNLQTLRKGLENLDLTPEELKAALKLLDSGMEEICDQTRDQTVANVEQILQELRALNPDAQIILVGYYNPLPFLPTYGRHFRLLNRSVKALAQQYGADYVSIPYTSIANDGHPTVCGHKYIARQILKAVRK